MSAAIIDGKAFAEGLRARIAEAVPAFVEATGRKPGLAVVLVGEDPASQVYVRSKGKATVAAGLESFEHRLPDTATQETLIALVERLNADEAVDGILVQLPLPKGVDEKAVIATIDPAKDVDGFHIANAGRLAVGEDALVPCTPLGCLMLLKDRLGDLSGLDAVVVGRPNMAGKPLGQLLLQENCTATLAHPGTSKMNRLELESLAKAGLAGLEVFHSDHNPSVREKYLALAQQFDLVPTAGSDFHGEKVAPGRHLGTASMPPELFAKLRSRAGQA